MWYQFGILVASTIYRNHSIKSNIEIVYICVLAHVIIVFYLESANISVYCKLISIENILNLSLYTAMQQITRVFTINI